MSDLIKEKWITRGGSIFSAVVRPGKSDFGVAYENQEAVAFNVGSKLANHIVKLHNATIVDLHLPLSGL